MEASKLSAVRGVLWVQGVRVWLGRAEKAQSDAMPRVKLMHKEDVRDGSSAEKCSNSPGSKALCLLR